MRYLFDYRFGSLSWEDDQVTVLVDWQIGTAVGRGTIGIDPFDSSRIQPNSYDISLGSEILFDVQDGTLDPFTDDRAYISVPVNNGCVKPQAFGLASTQETITLPHTIVAQVMGKSSLARDGLEIHATSGWLDAGFSGQITLELYNKSRRPIQLREGMAIGQVVFFETAPCERPYGTERGSKYQYQTGPTPSRYHLGRFV